MTEAVAPQTRAPAPGQSNATLDAIDAAVETVQANRDRWVDVGPKQRAKMLRACMARMEQVAPRWVEAVCEARGLDPNGPGSAEPFLTEAIPTMRCLRLLAEALEAGGAPKTKVWERKPGQYAAKVLPCDGLDGALFAGISGELWLKPGVEPTQGAVYRSKRDGKVGPGKVALVLGAGNANFIPPTDALHKLIAEDQVVVVKTNPVNAYMRPLWEEVLQPFVEAGFVQFVDGGRDVGEHLTTHDAIDTLHITGSAKAHDAIIWGSDPEEQARRKAAGEPLNPRPISSELGCVSPIFVVPGEWSESDLDYHARHIATAVESNASFMCAAGKVLVVAKGWPQREAFLSKVREVLAQTPMRKAYYPGAQQRYDRILQAHPEAVPLGERTEDVIPWTVIPSLSAEPGHHALENEAFCGVLAEMDVDAGDPETFLQKAIPAANELLWGTLSCTFLVDPKTHEQHREQVEQAIEDLRYGTVGVNIWGGFSAGIISPAWGAFPGHTLEDIQSGQGFVHNTYLFDHPQKTVIRAPFRIKPSPPWFVGHRNIHVVGRRLLDIEANRSWLKVPGVAWAALRG